MTSIVPVKKNEHYTIGIKGIGHSGEGVGRIGDFIVFVDNAIPGDLVETKIIKVKKNYAIGKLINIEKPSKARIESQCSIADKCGGCQIQHIDYNKQLDIKKQQVIDNIERIGKLTGVEVKNTIGMENPWRYRNKAQYKISPNGLGFFAKRTHNIITNDTCYIQHELSEKVAGIINQFIKEYPQVTIYEEQSNKGLLRGIVTRVSYATNEVMVIIVINDNKLTYSKELVDRIIKEIPEVKSMYISINKKRTNVVLGEKNVLIYGKEKIIDYISDLKFEISPLSFFQVNPVQTKVLYEKALQYANLNGDEIVFDLYCGIGTISLFLAQKAKKVYGIEVVGQAIEDAKKNTILNNIDNVEFIEGKAEVIVPEMIKPGVNADVVVLDPPRKGCDQSLLKVIAQINPKKIVYVSCNPSTLARDLAILDDFGYKTIEVQPVDMFPHTMHVECVVLMCASSEAGKC